MNQSLLDALLWNGEGEPPLSPESRSQGANIYDPDWVRDVRQFDQIIAARKQEAEVRKAGADVLLNVCRSHYQHVRDPNAHGDSTRQAG